MKIVLIHGQNHQGSTYHLGRILVENLAEEKDITQFFLPKDLNHFCMGCYACMNDEKKCPCYKEKKIIEDAMKEADLLVITTPTYCMAPSAPLKAFIDLFYQYWIPHRPRKEMFYKKAVVLSTAAGSGMKHALKPVKRTLSYWGIPYIKTYGLAVQAANWADVKQDKKDKIESQLNKLAKKVEKARIIKPSLYIRFLFKIMAKMKKKESNIKTQESLYWEENGWLNQEVPWKS